MLKEGCFEITDEQEVLPDNFFKKEFFENMTNMTGNEQMGEKRCRISVQGGMLQNVSLMGIQTAEQKVLPNSLLIYVVAITDCLS